MKEYKVQSYVSKNTKDHLQKMAKEHALSESTVVRLLLEATFTPEKQHLDFLFNKSKMKISGGQTRQGIYLFSTDLPDGEYAHTDMVLKISDGKYYPKYPVGCYLVDKKTNPVFPLLNHF